MRAAVRMTLITIAGALGAALVVPTAAPAIATNPATARQADFAAAAAEFGVPENVLSAVSYDETAWEAHAGRPSTTGAYGPMALTDVPATAKGDGAAIQSLRTAADLLHAAPATLRSDDRANIRGGAALLAADARALGHGALPAGAAGWYPAVARYSGSADLAGARQFADTVYTTIRQGAAATTADGQRLVLAAQPGMRPDTSELAGLGVATHGGKAPDCPKGLSCTFVPSAYAQTGPDAGTYGNYDIADRPNKHLSVHYIVIHDTEESYAATVSGFQNPKVEASANYVVDGTAGTVTQMVPDADVAWHAGNWYVNMHAIGIEQVGFAVRGATWFTEQLYRTTAALVGYLARRYGIRLDRQHVIGHDNVPGIAPGYIAGMHWDPGPFWDWNRFMGLLGQRTVPTGSPDSKVVTINPVFADNIQQVTDCEQNQQVPAQAASFVYLRTAPNSTAPLFNDPGLAPAGAVGTTCAADWGDKASAGQQFAVAGRQGDWVAIWWDGAEVWFQNPKAHPVATPTSTLVVRPKPGLASVATYGVAYPDAADYPADIPPRTVTPLPYTIQSGQSYVFGGDTPTDYYYAQTIDNSLPDDHTDVVGRQPYLEVQLGHRIAFVKATDVQVVPAVG